LTRFSRLIRLILDNSKQDVVPLEDELEALELYIGMESLRFDNRFRAHLSVAPGVNTHAVQVPPLLLQPFVENAIWHGLMHKEGAGDVWIDVSRSDGQLIIKIEDNGIGRQKAAAYTASQTIKRKSHGLQITNDRLSMLNRLTDKKASADVADLYDKDGAATGTRVTLTLPLFKEQAYESAHS
jgi:LytS/YehU family sensor histidine kinase